MALPARPIRALAFLTVALAFLGSPAAALAQPTAAAVAAPSAAGTAIVRQATITSNFPSGLTFHFDIAAHQPITRIDLLYRASNDTTLTLAEPAFTPATEVSLSQAVDLETAGVPPGIILRYHWRIVEQGGAVTETPEQSVDWTDARFAWTSLPGPDVTVFAYNGDRAFDQSVLDRAEQTIGTLKDRFGATPKWPIRIWVYNDKADFDGALAPNSEPWIAGAAFPWYGLILAILPDGNM
ncbi:MAG TPA: hypothetical protein VFQ80_10395, partial [Thermomicrobiales bacterium]|nr:hypothetical protein [Thermomicrobiales bacterium]